MSKTLPWWTLSKMLPWWTLSKTLPWWTLSKTLPWWTLSKTLPWWTLSKTLPWWTMSKTLPWWTLSKTLPWWTHCRSLCTALTLQEAQALEGNKTFTYNVILPGHHSVTSRLYIHIHTAVISPDKQDRLWRKLLCVKFENCYKRKDRHPGKTFVHQDGF